MRFLVIVKGNVQFSSLPESVKREVASGSIAKYVPKWNETHFRLSGLSALELALNEWFCDAPETAKDSTEGVCLWINKFEDGEEE